MNMEQLEALFWQFTQRLGLSKPLSQNAWKLYRSLHQVNESLFQETPSEWYATVVYLTLLEKKHSASNCTSSVSVSAILDNCKLRCTDFMTKLRIVMEQKHLSRVVEDSVKLAQKKYLISCALYDKYCKIMVDIFIDEPSQADYGSKPNFHNEITHQKRLVWVLYLLAKVKLPHNAEDLVTAFYIMLCCVVPVVDTTPSFLLKSPWDLMVTPKQSGQGISAINIMRQLCEVHCVDFNEIDNLIFSTKDWATFLATHQERSLDLAYLTKQWSSIAQALSVNELDFLDRTPLFAPKTENKTNTNEILNSQTPPQTPIRRTMNTIQHVKLLLTNFSDTPNAELREFFQSCAENPSENIEFRVTEMRDRYVNAFMDQLSSSCTAEESTKQREIPLQRFKLIARLYYRVLESMLKQEEARLSRSDFGSLLHNDIFHRTLITSASLVVSHAYSLSDKSACPQTLEKLLDCFKVEPYHLCKVIESFIKAEPALSRDALKHLQYSENVILERLAWTRSSPLHEILQCDDATSTPVTMATAPTDTPTKFHTASSQFLSPMKPPRVASTSRDDHPYRSKSLTVFLHKVCRLGYQRLQLICLNLCTPKDVMHKIWTCLEYCIMYRGDLLKDRHLDQIMLCCVYAISKVVDKEIKFKTIVAAYKTLPHSPPIDVYKKVFIADGLEPDSVIGFYNKVFMQSTKTYLLQFSPSRRPPPISPAPKIGVSPVRQSPKMMKQNFFVSPMKEGDIKTTMTPRSMLLFCGDAESASKMKSINDAIKQSATPTSTQKRLNFERREQQDASPSMISKRLKFDQS